MLHADIQLLAQSSGAPQASWYERRRGDRLPADITASIRARGSAVRTKAEVADLSANGCKLISREYETGDEVLIALAHLTPIIGRVCWAEEGAVGVEFSAPLHPSVVKHLSTL